ncbi:MAG: CBS domain-containing protein [Pseudomonadota bacterium]
MPESYTGRMRQDRESQRTYSQSVTTNSMSATANVATLLGSKGRDVFSIKPDDTLGHAVELLRDHRIGALVVTDDSGALVGILSERDIVRKLAETPGKTLPQQVKEVMTSKVETCTPDDPLVSVLQKMTAGRFRHLPALDDSGKLVGVVTIGDVIGFRLRELEHETLQLKQLIVG